MIELIKELFGSENLTALHVALISVFVTVSTFFLTSYFKNLFENSLHARKLNTQHRLEEQKKIKEEISKYKIHLLTLCEDLDHRFLNLEKNHSENWIMVNSIFNEKENYYFHSTIYRFLCLYFWIKKAQKNMIFLDTTIASKKDLEFIIFLKIFPNIMCDLDFILGPTANPNSEGDHFFKNIFEAFPDCILDNDMPKSFEKYNEDLQNLQENLKKLYIYFDGISPTESRNRWDRIHFLHLTVILFLNNYGYDFQKTNKEQLLEILRHPKRSIYLENYLNYLKKYKLHNNKEVKKLIKLLKII
ncbi:hypothetical protein [Acinetobacter sp. ANC 4973]|uniref:hypothetical protein n=1 Tax=Acinetobacter sp. ANC 4973 TaxID=1977871 RepID=UPI000A34941B|nr:hypothetical protein [Acinetobacter sp. ANC 4973]OTG99118.1 hypothetical protein B9T30_10955 [Acinetobacter sp. ANC 4973]